MKMLVSTCLLFLLVSAAPKKDFLTEQKQFQRVRTAISEKQNYLEQKLKENQLDLSNLNILFVAYKEDGVLDVYAKTKQETTYRKILSYPICASSGGPGPKRKSGDGQVPEGFYHINRFNPSSNFHLSLGLNYPNLADQRKNPNQSLGGDIFIHGSCVTIGCLPMTDNYIKEIYLLAVHAKNNGQSTIPVYVFPFKMSAQQLQSYKARYNDKTLSAFWDNLKTGYDLFSKEHKALNVKVAGNGDYTF